MQINIDRLKTTLLELSRIGFNETDKGIYRTSFSEAAPMNEASRGNRGKRPGPATQASERNTA